MLIILNVDFCSTVQGEEQKVQHTLRHHNYCLVQMLGHNNASEDAWSDGSSSCTTAGG